MPSENHANPHAPAASTGSDGPRASSGDDAVAPKGTILETTVPTRLDALPWSRWHTKFTIALGITWLLDGLEGSLIANLGPILMQRETLGLSGADVGYANSAYLVGQVTGALVFGQLTDRFGRKLLFLLTLALYLAGTFCSGLAFGFWSFALFRFVAGLGIGGEYAAVNSAIDELIPARVRGHVDLGVNGTNWLGVGMGAALSMVVLNPGFVPARLGWRAAFTVGALLGLVILFLRRHLPESPRWLLTHGREREADEVVRGIEQHVLSAGADTPVAKARVRVTGAVGFFAVLRAVFGKHKRRAFLGFTLMSAQSIFYNGIFFTYALVLAKHYGIADDRVGLYMLPFAAGNFLGPILLGRLFDTLGRKVMIAATYGISGALLAITGYLFMQGVLSATTQTIAWCVTFFFASSAASSAYLTVSELFPVELRAMAIALFYALATCIGAPAPAIFARLVESGSRPTLFVGYLVAGGLMVLAAIAELVFGEAAEGKSLEQINAA